MKKLLASAVCIGLLCITPAASASWRLAPAAREWAGPAGTDSTTNCAQDGQFQLPAQGDGCIRIIGSGLHVDTLQAGVTDVRQDACGYYLVSKNGYVIHKSAWRCVSSGDPRKNWWGPIYTQDQNYQDNTQFCGWFSAWPGFRGCARVSP